MFFYFAVVLAVILPDFVYLTFHVSLQLGYGMPRVAYELGAVEQQLPLASIGEEILKLTTARKEGAD